MAFFQKIKEAFIKNEDKDKYLSGLDRSKKKEAAFCAASLYFHRLAYKLAKERSESTAENSLKFMNN